MKLKETHKYDDIIHLSPPNSGKRAKMSRYDRAAQFSPFAALTGFEDAITETGRLTHDRLELEEDEKQRLDEQMRKILEQITNLPKVKIVWFCYDERKAGGAYRTTTGCVKKIDTYHEQLILTSGQSIPLGEVYAIDLLR